MPNNSNPTRLTRTKFTTSTWQRGITSIAWALLITAPASADTAYRCGDAYSALAQCPSGQPVEVKTTSVPRSSAQDTNAAAMRDMREAEALEKKRLQAERQAGQNAALRLSAPGNLGSTSPPYETERAPMPSKGKHMRKPPNPYFTAKDPSAPTKKKGNAKALPSAN